MMRVFSFKDFNEISVKMWWRVEFILTCWRILNEELFWRWIFLHPRWRKWARRCSKAHENGKKSDISKKFKLNNWRVNDITLIGFWWHGCAYLSSSLFDDDGGGAGGAVLSSWRRVSGSNLPNTSLCYQPALWKRDIAASRSVSKWVP